MLAATHANTFREASRSQWPIERPYLAALKDLGLSDEQVASYFRVKQDDVTMLRAFYGIAERPGLAGHRPPSRRRFARRRRA